MELKEILERLDFRKGGGIIPAVVQDDKTKEVLMLGYMNREALEKTLATGFMHYYSRSKGKLWMKGEESGHYQLVREAYYDCDGDTLLFKVEQVEACCHEGYYTCFHNKIISDARFDRSFNPDEVYGNAKILGEIFKVVKERMEKPKEDSYVSNLAKQGTNAVARKVGEEALELILAAKDHAKEEIISEAADLLFHTLVLLAKEKIELEEVYATLKKRRKATT
ncbi:MAG: bifunctional phosphoribosyl-AMP cyclohydrolase/phosphoribosyl-ATP diphosphatase HisIE [Candidatus Freyarchaeota archaeon]|nr:bifunctional phosphoribosyl-AMP cyclohydrolase/phosphoribosyl-ATP diphosphatase HisIE [Candidatus Jordarchaeia archaeon]